MVTDVTRMGEWSPETVKGEWIDGATGPAVGARFKGTNRKGFVRWSTKPRVVTADEGCEFAFVTETGGKEQTKWCYRFEPDAGGANVTESFEMMNDVPGIISFAEKHIMRIKDRKADLEKGMQATLERIKAAVEGSAS
ncbi:MAG TPA: SRPBCC family protein [Acidimicrobiales bacterium]|nr:SRPBCC family protein [Acidimicrobiales bacterium]